MTRMMTAAASDRRVYRPVPIESPMPICANDEASPMVLIVPDKIDSSVEQVDFAAGGTMSIVADENRFALLLLRSGAGRIHADRISFPVTPMQAMVLGRGEGRIEWAEAGQAMLVHLSKAAAQILASAEHGGARRLSQQLLPLDLAQADGLADAAADLAQDAAGGVALLREALAAMVAQHGVDVAFPPSRSIGLARANLDQCRSEPFDLAQLAQKSGVTAITLQRGFKACFGMTVAAYSQAVRLHAARARLRSGWESRSIAEIATVMGFPSAKTFVRAYQKLLGETPTKTRSGAFQFSNVFHIDST